MKPCFRLNSIPADDLRLLLQHFVKVVERKRKKGIVRMNHDVLYNIIGIILQKSLHKREIFSVCSRVSSHLDLHDEQQPPNGRLSCCFLFTGYSAVHLLHLGRASTMRTDGSHARRSAEPLPVEQVLCEISQIKPKFWCEGWGGEVQHQASGAWNAAKKLHAMQTL